MEKIPVPAPDQSIETYFGRFAQLVKNAFGEEKFKSWLSEVGIKSRINFKHTVAGRRNLNVENLKGQLDLSFQEATSFEKPQSVNSEKPLTYYVSEEFLSSPINTIILNLCGIKTLMTQKMLHEILGNVFEVGQIDGSIDLLVKENLMALKGDHLVRIFEGTITSVPGIKSDASKKYFETVNSLSNTAWNFPLELREIQSYTLRLEKKDISRLKDLVRNFRADCYRLSNPDARDSVFQCSVSAFPVFID